MNIVILNTARGAATNSNGFYLISRVPPGEYDIVASVIGYRRKVEHVIITSGQPMDLNFQLTAAPVESQEILVTGARGRDDYISVKIIEQKDVKLIPALAQEDIFQSLKILPGVVSTNDVSSRFFVRGGAGDQNLVILDGLKIFSPFHTMGIFSVFDPDILQYVETYTGAFSPEFGDRLSSVINLTSRDGRSDRPSVRASLNFLSAKLLLEGPGITGTTWLVNVRKSAFSETFKRIVNQDIPVKFYDGFGKFSAQFAGGAKFDLSVLSTSDDLNLSQGSANSSGPRPTQVNYFWRSTAVGGTFSYLGGDRVFLQLSAYFSGYEAGCDSSSSRGASTTTNTIRDYGLRALATYYTNSRDLCMFGFDFGFPTLYYNLTNLAGFPIRFDNSFVEGRAWFRYQIHLQRWLLDLGIHTDFGSFVAGELGLQSLQPRINVSYDLFDNWKAKAAFGLCSQRTMTLNNEDDVTSIFDAWVKIPSNFPAETATQYVLGMNSNLSDAASLSVETYYKRYRSLVVYNRNKILVTDPDYIEGAGRSYGAELLVRSKIWRIDFYGSYSLGWTRIENDGYEYAPQYDRRHSINLLAVGHPMEGLDCTLRWTIGSGLPFTANLGYYDRLVMSNPIQDPFQFETGVPYLATGEKNAWHLPTYYRLDVSLNFRFAVGGMKGAVGGQIANVYDNINVYYFDRNTGRHADMLRFFPSATVTLEY